MPKTKISEFSSTPANNTDIDSINLAEGCAPSGINDAIRELMSQLKDWQSGTSNDPMVIGSSGSLTLNQGTANGVAYLNGSKVVTSGSALTFDGTNFATTGNGTFSGILSRIHAQGTDAYITNTTTGKANTVMGFNDSGSTTAQGIPTGYAYYGTLQSYPIGFTSGGYLTNSISSTAHIWNTTGSEQMRLTSTGLGIGTSSPNNRLQVNVTNNTAYSSTNTLAGGVVAYIKNASTTNSTDATIRLEATGSGSVAATSISAVYTADGAGAITFGTRSSPASDVTERMRLDSSGNLGLGVTPSAWFSVYKPMQLGSYGAAIAGQTNAQSLSLWNNAYPNASNVDTYTTTNAANKFRMDGGAFQWFTAPSGTAGNAITFTQAMTLDASGNLNVGRTTTVNNARFMSAGSSVAYGTEWGDTKYMSQMYFNSEYYVGVMASAATRELRLESNSSDALARITFYTGASGTTSERARIDSSGNLLLGTTSATGRTGVTAKTVSYAGSSQEAIYATIDDNSYFVLCSHVRTTSGIRYHIGFGDGTTWTERGTISTNGTSTTYSTASDYRLKNTIAPMTGALAKVALLKPCTYKWNADGSAGEGFIAHELAEVVPQCVTGAKDAVDENGNPKYQGIDTSFLVATVVAALQELKAEFDAYKASHP